MPNPYSRPLAWTAGFLATVIAARRLAAALGPRYELKDKVVLITGGTRGLGLEIARRCLDEGARGMSICARERAEVEQARAELAERAGADRVLALVCDVTHRAQVDEFVRRTRERFGEIDVLINNAGVIEVGPLTEMTLDDFTEAMSTHFYAPLHATLAVLPAMRARRAGRIVNISSIGGKIAVPHLLPYCASKFALVGFSEGLHAELKRDGIVVTTVCPGLMRTGSDRNAFFKGRHRAERAWFSLSAASPLTSISSERAARQIVDALCAGTPEIVLSPQARLAATFYALFPGLGAELAALANRVLPPPGGIGTRRARGTQSASRIAPSPLTILADEAARRNNETQS